MNGTAGYYGTPYLSFRMGTLCLMIAPQVLAELIGRVEFEFLT